MAEKVRIAVMFDPERYQWRPRLKGFIERPIKKMTIKWAPSYNGKGPYRDRTVSYIELKDKKGKKQRWPIREDDFLHDVVDGKVERIMAVTLRRCHKMPDDLVEAPDWCKF